MSQAIPVVTADAIQCGEDYSVSFNAGTYLAVESTTNATPIVVTITNHGFSNGETKILTNCQDNAANGTWVIANKTTHTFELVSSSGTLAGGAKGQCTTPYDITGKTPRSTARDGSVLGATLTQQFTITVNDPTTCDITLSMAKALTEALQTAGVQNVYTDVWADAVPLIALNVPVIVSATIIP